MRTPYITRVFWVSYQVREIYETAIEAAAPYGLADADCKRMCLRYAALERRLGEIDRARAILVHASSLADPRGDPGFWKDWNDFEVAHGNEDTFRRAAEPGLHGMWSRCMWESANE